ncbi:MAG: CHAT domain-containing protein [Lewinellaceae bacterium]|nr:CHAT domain-containing protein [Lewinellaceae bacterium]
MDSLKIEQTIDSLIDAGKQCRIEQRFEEGIHLAQTAAALILEHFGDMHPDYTACLHAESISYVMMGENEKALPIMLRAREIRERTYGKENENYLNHLYSLFLINWDLEHYAEAEKYIREYIALNEKMAGRESARYRTALNSLSHILKQQRRFLESDSCFQELIGLQIKVYGPDHPEVGRICVGHAFMLRDWGRFEAAEQQLIKGVTICEKKSAQIPLYYPDAVNCLGMIYAETYRFDLAEQYYRKALDGYAASAGKASSDYAIALDNLGNLYSSLGLSAQDAALKEEALGIMRTNAEPGNPDFIRMLTNTASTYCDLYQLEESEALLREAEQMYEQAQNKEMANACQIPYVQGSLFLKKKEYRQAEFYQSKATELIRSNFGSTHPYFFTSAHQQAEILLALGEYAKADDLLAQTKAGLLGSMGKGNIDYVKYLNAYSDLLFATGRRDSLPVVLQEYSTLLKQLIRQGAQHLSEHELAAMYGHFQNYSRKIFSYTWQINPARNTILPGTCFNQSLFDKGFLLNASIQLRNLAVEDTATVRMYQQLLNAKRYLSAQYVRPIAERLEVPELENDIAELEKELARQVPGFKNAIREVSWQEVQQQLPPASAAIEWINFQYQTDQLTDSVFYAALLLRPGWEAPQFIPLFEEKQLDSLLHTQGERRADYVNLLYTIAERGINPQEKQQKSLYEMLWKPIEKELAGTTTIYYSPSGLLHRLNLAAIPIGIDSVLGDRYHLVDLGSSRQLVVPTAIKSAANDAVLFGGIQYDVDNTAIIGSNAAFNSTAITSRGKLYFSYTDSTLRTGIWNELPFTEREANSVEKMLKASGFQTDSRRGSAATEDFFQNIGAHGKPSPRVLHIATHGFFFPDPKTSDDLKTSPTFNESVFKLSDHPMIRSGLLLAGANHAWQTGKPIQPDMADGILTAYEISQMNLSNTELVVLSACETGLGDIQGNEGVYGLQRAFKIAGVKYLIMSLWQVPDKQTSLLMTTFYKKWLEEKMTIPEAFLSAQKALRDAGLDPYQWAGFVLLE